MNAFSATRGNKTMMRPFAKLFLTQLNKFKYEKLDLNILFYAVVVTLFVGVVGSIVMSTSVYICETVCLSVCQRGYFRNHLTLFAKFFVHVAYGHGTILLRRCDEIPRVGTFWGVFFLIDNALYTIAFGKHTKTAEPIEMLFGLMTQVGHDGGPDPQGQGAIVRGCSGHLKALAIAAAVVAKGIMQQKGTFSIPSANSILKISGC